MFGSRYLILLTPTRNKAEQKVYTMNPENEDPLRKEIRAAWAVSYISLLTIPIYFISSGFAIAILVICYVALFVIMSRTRKFINKNK